jgi:hypothetical protein
MSGASSAKELLSRFDKARYKTFILNTDTELVLPEVSYTPGIGASKRNDVYKKIISHPQSDQHIKFIYKNDELHTLVWQTRAERLKKGVRWGIIKPQSITGKVISTLGNYRVTGCKRVAKGLISNTQVLKTSLLDLFQDRFEALEDLESLVNKNNTAGIYEAKINAYTIRLHQIRSRLNSYFNDVSPFSGLTPDLINRLDQDLQHDIQRAESYLKALKSAENLHPYNRARGTDSIVEFVKQQMVQGLYELQGVNQDITYSSQRDFALTRGELNDFIEDARKEIDDYQTDIRNAVTAKHHGQFASEGSLVSYDFAEDSLSPERERDVMLAISFIEEWDKLDNKTLSVYNESGSEKLRVISSPKWIQHKSFLIAVESFFFYIVNMFKSILVSTTPTELEAWENPQFHLVATELKKHSRLHEPMWKKPVNLLKSIFFAITDAFNGVHDFGSQLVIELPHNMRNNWNACNEVTPLAKLLKGAEHDLSLIKKEEQTRLDESLQACDSTAYPQNQSPATSQLATVEYNLSPGEQNDILTAMARGVTEFSTVFSHNLFAKDPVKGLVSSGAFAVGASALLMPALSTSIFGAAYVNWFTNFAYAMSSSKFSAVLAGGSAQAQLAATGWDALINGPGSNAVNNLYHLGEDPLTAAAYLATATGLGYFLVNGVAGYPIPWISAFLKEDLGTSPELSYPFIGAKTAILLYKVLKRNNNTDQFPQLSTELMEMAHDTEGMDSEERLKIERFILVSWLSVNADALPKLEHFTLLELSRHIEALFPKEQSDSLKKILYPETPRSIAFQFFSIPLTYIPATLRLLFSPVLTLFALIEGKSHPFAPMQREADNLFGKCKRDLSRLLVFSTYVASLVYTLVATPIKAIAYLITMAVGRVAGLFDIPLAHSVHKLFALCHIFFRNVGEYFYPARAIKDVTVAHPAHAMKEVEESYVAVLKQTGKSFAKTEHDYQNPGSSALFSNDEAKQPSIPLVCSESLSPTFP